MKPDPSKQIDELFRQIIRDEFDSLINNNQSVQYPSRTLISPTEFFLPDNIILFGWLKDKELLPKVHEIIHSSALIKCNVNEYIPHYYGTSRNLKPIQWFGHNNMLAQLMIFLMGCELINTVDDIYKIIATHHADRNGRPLNAYNLRITYAQMSTSGSGFKTIELITDKIKKLIHE